MEIPKDLKEEVWNYCRVNDIPNIDDFLIQLVRQGFTVEKFGATPYTKEPDVIIEEKIVEVEVEKIVEKIVEKEVTVEKIVEKEVYITNDDQVLELTNNLSEKEREFSTLKTNSTKYLTQIKDLEDETAELNGEIKVLSKKLNDKINDNSKGEEITNLKGQLEECSRKLKIKINQDKPIDDLYDEEKKGGYFGSNLLGKKK